MNSSPSIKFEIGNIIKTADVEKSLTAEDISTAIARHQAGDWGEVGAHDRELNEKAVVDGTRLLSVYNSAAGQRFWVITNAQRSSTQIMLPSDY